MGSTTMTKLQPLSWWWGLKPLAASEARILRMISLNGAFQIVVPFLCYHLREGPRDDPRYKFPCTLSHSIRRPGVARTLYQLGYVLFVVLMAMFAWRRRAVGAARTLVLLVIG